MKYTADRSRISQLVAAEMSYFGSKYALSFIAGSTALVSMVSLLFSMFFNAGQIGAGQNYIYLVISACALAAFFAAYALYRVKASREGMQYDNVLIFTAECFVISGFAGLVILRTSWMWQLIELSPGQFNRYLKTISLFAVIVPLAVAALYAVFTFINTDGPLPYMGWLYKIYTFVPASVLLFVFMSTGASGEERAINTVTVTSAIYISLILGFTVHFVAKLLMLKYLEETPARYETFIKVKHAKTAAAAETAPAPVMSRESFEPSFEPDIEPETLREKVAAYADDAKANVEKAKSFKDRMGELASGVAGLFGSKKNAKPVKNTPAPAATWSEDAEDMTDEIASLVEPELVVGSELEAAVADAAEAAADAAEGEDDSAGREEQARLAAQAEELERQEAERKAAEEALETERRAAEAEELARIEEEAERDREEMLALEIAEQARREALAEAPAVEHKAAVIEQTPDAPSETEEQAPSAEGGMARLRKGIKDLFADLRTPLDGLYLEGGEQSAEPSEKKSAQPGEEYIEAPLAELGGEFVIGTDIEGAQTAEKPAESEIDKTAESAKGEKQRVGQFFESHRKRVNGVPDEQLRNDYAAPPKKLAPKKPTIIERIIAFFRGAPAGAEAAASALERLRAMADEKARFDGLYESYERLARGESEKPADEPAETPTAEQKIESDALARLTAMALEKQMLESGAPLDAEAAQEASVEPAAAQEQAPDDTDKTTLADAEAAPEPAAQPQLCALERLSAMAKDKAALDAAGAGGESVEAGYQPVESGSALERLLAIKNRTEQKAQGAPADATQSDLPAASTEGDTPRGLFETPYEGPQTEYLPIESALEFKDEVSALIEPPEGETERERTDELVKAEAALGSEGALERLAAIAARRGMLGEAKPTESSEPSAGAIAETPQAAQPVSDAAQISETAAQSDAKPADVRPHEPDEPDIIEQLDDEHEPEPASEEAGERQPDEPLTEVMDDDFAKLRSYAEAQPGAQETETALSRPEGGESGEESAGDADGLTPAEENEPDEGGESAKRAPIRAQVVRRSTVRPHSSSRRKPPHRR